MDERSMWSLSLTALVKPWSSTSAVKRMPCPTPVDHLKHCLETTQSSPGTVPVGEKMVTITLVNGGMKECVSCTSSQHLLSLTSIGPLIHNQTGTDGNVMILESRTQYHLETSGRFMFVKHWIRWNATSHLLSITKHELKIRIFTWRDTHDQNYGLNSIYIVWEPVPR